MISVGIAGRTKDTGGAEKAGVGTVLRGLVLLQEEENGLAHARRDLHDLRMTRCSQRHVLRLQRHGEVLDLHAAQHALRCRPHAAPTMRRHAAFWKVSFTFPRKWYLPSFENTRFRKAFCPCLIGYSSNSYASPPSHTPTAALAT